MAPVFAARMPVLKHWNTPIDFGASIKGERIFGDNKTWRGLFSGTVAGSAVGVLQFISGFGLIEALPQAALVGAALGFGALLGDAVKSFFKRRQSIPPGKSWIPLDQTDYIVGGLLLAYPLAANVLSLELAVIIAVTYTVLHFLFSYLGYLLGLKSQPI